MSHHEAPTGDSAARIDDVVQQALSRVLLGLHPRVQTDGVTATATFTPEAEHRGAPGWVHGGLLATLLDHVGARLASAALDARVATGTLELRYRQPVLIDGGPYHVDARAESPGSRTVRIHARILGPDDRPLTEANGLFVAVAALAKDRDA
ncbi:MAG: PaaI family thioesterase [Acidimicrobiales bacterium]